VRVAFGDGLSLACIATQSIAALRCAAFKWFSLAADKGDARAQYNLGHCYEHGTGTKPNVLEAAVLYRKAAEKGNAKAYFRSDSNRQLALWHDARAATAQPLVTQSGARLSPCGLQRCVVG
jgi:TPR repeat protein